MTAGRLPMGISPAQECVDAMMAFPAVARPYHDSVLNSHPSQHHLSCSPRISLKEKLSSRNNSSLKDISHTRSGRKHFGLLHKKSITHCGEDGGEEEEEGNKQVNQ